MNSPAIDIITMLDGESSLGFTEGVDLFISRLPGLKKAPDTCIAVLDGAGEPPQLTMRKETSDYYIPTITVQSRAAAYNTAWQNAQNILEFLHGESGVIIGTTLYPLIRALGNPQVLHFDKNDRPVAFVNFEVHRRDV